MKCVTYRKTTIRKYADISLEVMDTGENDIEFFKCLKNRCSINLEQFKYASQK